MENPLTDKELERMNAYWRACNYLSVGMIYLKENPLLRVRRPHARLVKGILRGRIVFFWRVHLFPEFPRNPAALLHKVPDGLRIRNLRINRRKRISVSRRIRAN